MLDWLQEVIRARHPDPQKSLSPVNSNGGWYGSIQPCRPVYKDHWGLPLWDVCDAHVEHAAKALPSQEMPSGFFPTESLAREWLTYIKQPAHPRTLSLVRMTQLSESRKNYGRPIIERFKDSVDEAIGQLAKHGHFTSNAYGTSQSVYTQAHTWTCWQENSKNCECAGSGTGPHTVGVRPWIRACRRYRRPHAVYCSGMGAEGS